MEKISTVDSPANVTGLQRLEMVKADPVTMSIVAQRVADGETLKEMALDWDVPHGLFQLWIGASSDRMAVYESALRMRADAEIHNALKASRDEFILDKDGEFILDENGAPIKKDVRWARLQVATSLKVAEKWDSGRFGPKQAKQERNGEISDEGIGELARRLAGAFAARSGLPG
ncbi:hypothetical protein [Nitrosospira sp. Nsp1]|uniref:terminase small subunit-like protein n=1 Tax=Nitrosospira sp. Nsp1 TaxID=136547 RepID=UPI00088E40DA|nr:hypothetical protein [Nitrosospira sp. Nsp1]SCX58937.1 hypothetical protein SAMN05720354_12224 [Nitrosospira sp. Nsp1]